MPFGKWKDFGDCVQDFMSQGKDEESAKRICGALQARLGKESFSWVGSVKHENRNLIRGKALHPIKTVHPEEWPSVRVYLEEELRKSAHTLKGTPLLLDHMYPLDGRVLDAKYEDGAIEYVAELNDERVLNWIRHGAIKHCSVEYDWSSLVKLNGVAPRGLKFTGLALLKNFEPGDLRSSVEIWSRIAETLREARLKEQGEPREFIYYELRDPAAFLKDRFSTMWIDKVNGIQAIYGRLRDNPENRQPMALLFMKADGWSLDQIKTWLQDHPQYVKSPGTEPSTVGVQANMAPAKKTASIGEMKLKLEERVWTQDFINSLPDSAFAIILPGGVKEDGKTMPRNLRKFPHHSADGSLDLPHLRNANARVPQSDLSDAQKARAMAHLNEHKKAAGIGEVGEEESVKRLLEQTDEVPEEEIGEVPEVPEELDISSEPTLDEVIASIEEILGSISESFKVLAARVDAVEKAAFGDAEAGPFEGSRREVERLENEMTILKSQKEALEDRVSTLEREKAELAEKLGEAVIEPHGQQEDFKQMVLRELKAAVYERVPRHWGYGPHEQNRRIKALIKSLEEP